MTSRTRLLAFRITLVLVLALVFVGFWILLSPHGETATTSTVTAAKTSATGVSTGASPSTELLAFEAASHTGSSVPEGDTLPEAGAELGADPLSGPDPVLFPVNIRGEWGFVDRTGVVVIAPQFAEAPVFSEGLAAAAVIGGDRLPVWGFIDATGHWVVQPRFQSAGPMSEGLALVGENSRFGFIDRSGAWAIQPAVDMADRFEEGLAPAALAQTDGTLLWGYLDSSGNWALRPQWESATSFSDGVAAVTQDGEVGLVDTSGTFIVPPGYTFAQGYSEGLALVRTRSGEGPGFWAFVDREGSVAVDSQYRSAEPFSQGLAVASVDGRATGYIDKTGAWAIPPAFDQACSFSEDLAAVHVAGAGYGYIDQAGNMVVEPVYGVAGRFAEGLAAVGVERSGAAGSTQGAAQEAADAEGQGAYLYGYIGKDGSWVVPPQFTEAGDFENGLAKVVGEDSEGYIDATGTYVFSQELE